MQTITIAEISAATIAADESTDPDTLRSIAAAECAGASTEWGDWNNTGELRCYLAHNPALPDDAVAALARDPRPWVRKRIARRPRLDAATLRVLAEDPDPYVRRAVQMRDMDPLAAFLLST